MTPDLLLDHRRSLTELLAKNRAFVRNNPRDTVTKALLEQLNRQAGRYLLRLEQDIKHPVSGPYGSAGYWGEQGHGPAIEDLCRLGQVHRGSAAALEEAA